MTRPPRRSAPSGAEGFVLVGVIMFVLALTILGLSLFGLSSYETQFLNRSFDGAQAENTALGEAERAKYRLSVSPFLLQTAGSNLPPGVTTLARQVQGGDTVATGAVDWDSGEPVLITVDATVKGITRRFDGRFNPTEKVNFYKRLITSYGKVIVNDDIGDGISRDHTVTMGGRVWQNYADTTLWTDHAASWIHGIRIGGVELPGVPQFVTEHLASPFSPAPPQRSPDGTTFTFNNPLGDVGYFKVDPASVEANHQVGYGDFYTFRALPNVTIKVNGHCVWVVPQGIRFENVVTVEKMPGALDASLVIVSPPNDRDIVGGNFKHVGVWFFAGLSSANVPVILVSDGGVNVEHFNNPHGSTYIDQLSIFAGRVFITGPEVGFQMQLNHNPTMDDVVDWYALHSALPNTSPTGDHDLALVPGTWQMRTP